MQALIVYESMYGDTREIAEAIAEGIREARPGTTAVCRPVALVTAGGTRDVDLLVVGGPTHVRGMSNALSRRVAVSVEARKEGHVEEVHEAATTAAGPGLRRWFHDLPDAAPGTPAAAFDTRLDGEQAGGAAAGIAQRLVDHHYGLRAEPEGFYVEDADGPLRSGELARAKAWGSALL
ncbi:flavodoxin domain-containing protein [Kitasatospora sp. NPDC093679]|uniref:flavodoxin domain-containing protein n=1 Tax=Kitasatospora sp. NPDC093679 TaxID=3154983 RepID=UPI0034488B1D